MFIGIIGSAISVIAGTITLQGKRIVKNAVSRDFGFGKLK